jgi:hypothetical protein
MNEQFSLITFCFYNNLNYLKKIEKKRNNFLLLLFWDNQKK